MCKVLRALRVHKELKGLRAHKDPLAHKVQQALRVSRASRVL